MKKLEEIFGTADVIEISKKIVKEGEVPITTEKRREMISEKRRKIISILSREGMDPRTNAPHTPQRIENAIDEAKVKIDPFKSAEEQIEDILGKLKFILPIKFERIKILVDIPIEISQKSYGIIKDYTKKEEWKSDYLSVLIEIPAGIEGEILDRINKISGGRAIIKKL